MMSCDTFRARFAPATNDPALLEHVRACDACLGVAAEVDPDMMFRALGGEMMPPGGLEPFVSDVMREVRLRTTEVATTRRQSSWTHWLAAAAALAVTFTGATVFYERGRGPAVAPAPMASSRPTQAVPAALAGGPAVETYDSETATIIEVSTEGPSDVKVVMIFDEDLPADL